MKPTRVRQEVLLLGVIIRLVVGVAVIAAGVFIFVALAKSRAEAPRVENVETRLEVTSIEARYAPVARTWRGYGAARAVNASNIAAEVGGAVVEWPETVRAGAHLSAGDLIIAIDASDYEDRLAISRERLKSLYAQLEALDVDEESLKRSYELAQDATRLQEWELERLKIANERGAGSDAEVRRLQRQLTVIQRQEQDLSKEWSLIPTRRADLQAQISMEQANIRLNELDAKRTRIVAPFAGSLQRVDARVGEHLSIGETVARIVDLSLLEVPLKVAVSASAVLRVGDLVELESDGPDRRIWQGEIVRIAPEVDPRTRTVTVFVEVKQDPFAARTGLLLPGQFLVARLRSSIEEDLIVVPRGSLDGDWVMIVNEDGRAAPREVSLSHLLTARFPDIHPEETQWAAIERGLSPGDEVIVSNLDDLSAGVQVVTTNAATATPRSRPAAVSSEQGTGP